MNNLKKIIAISLIMLLLGCANKSEPIVKHSSIDDMYKYYNDVVVWIYRHHLEPKEVKELNISGTGIIKFKIDRQGNLISSGITQSTGHDALDKAMEKVISDSIPMPKIPEELFSNLQEVSLEMAFYYGDDRDVYKMES